MKTKICSRCKKVKQLSEFGKYKNGLRPECKECKRTDDRAYKKTYNSEINIKKKAYREKNKESLNLKAKQRRETPERKKYMRGYLKTYLTSLKESNPEKYKDLRFSIKILNHQFYAKNKTKRKVTDITKEYLIELFLNTEKCLLCGVGLSDNGREMNGKQFDHIIPIINGGMHTKENIRVICTKCNRSRPINSSVKKMIIAS